MKKTAPTAAALALAAWLAVGCAGLGETQAPASRPPSSPAARPEAQEVHDGGRAAALLEVGGAAINAIALPAHEIVRAPSYSPAAAREALPVGAAEIRVTDVPGPAGPRRPGSRGWGAPAAESAAGELAGEVPFDDNAAARPIGGEPPTPAAPSLLTSFDSTDWDDNAAVSGSVFIPPDTHGAAGPEHLVSVTNVTVQFHTKAGASLCKTSLATLFSSLSPSTQLFDPKVLYDRHAQRWVIVALEQTDAPQVSRILVAVSNDSDPSDPGLGCGTWYQFAIDGKITIISTPHWTDYPGFAVDEEAVYVTGNLFSFAGGVFGGSRLWIIDKFAGSGGGFYGGGTATHSSALDPYSAFGIATTTQPARILGAPPAGNVGTYLVSYSGLTVDGTQGANGAEFVQVVRIDNPLGSPTFTQEFVNVGNLENLVTSPPLADAAQLGTALTIEVNDRRALSAAWRGNQLYLTATINPSSGADAGQATAHWWHLDTTVRGTTGLTGQGSIGGEDIATGTSTFFPSISVNAAQELTVGFSASDDSIRPSSYLTTRRPGDAAGTTSGSTLLRAGLDEYHRTFSGSDNRWGDYSASVIDPADQCFWVHNQHSLCISPTVTPGVCNSVVPNNNGRWGTSFGKLCIDCATTAITVNTPATTAVKHRGPEITVTGAGDVAGGHLTLEGQTIAIENGFVVNGLLSIFTGFCPLL